jgi:uncharacterized damage-inducible protein DinB
MSRTRAFLSELDQEGPNTRRVLERIPEEAFGWRPHQKSFTFGELATHTANIPHWGVDTLDGSSFDMAPGGEPIKAPRFETTQQVLDHFDAGLARFEEALRQAVPASFEEPWTLESNGEAMFTLPRVAVLRTMILNHLIHHRAQLTLYLRMNDLPVPALYGPSADEG